MEFRSGLAGADYRSSHTRRQRSNAMRNGPGEGGPGVETSKQSVSADCLSRLPPARQYPRDALEIFRARCEARAMLVTVSEMSLIDAVDELQAAAVADGLVAAHGQDEVQAIM